MKRHGNWDLIDFNESGSTHRAQAHQVGTARAQWSALDAIVEDRLARFVAADPGRIRLEGCDVQLSRKQATRLAIVVHELVANATRYGALSSPHGQISVQWRLSVNGLRRIYIRWSERTPSSLAISDKVGFGTRLIAQLVENYARVFEPSGMTCTFELDLGTIEDELP
jgi:two-component system CheB/CheR fusion protein